MVSFNADLVYSPEAEIEHLAKNAKIGREIDWKPAIILSATYLEKFAVERLKRYFAEKKKITLDEKLERRLSLPEAALLLYGLDLASPKNFTHMNQIWSARNDAVHMIGKTPKDYLGTEPNKTYGKMIQDALEIMAKLKGK